jgi:hypothetical protein
LVHNIHIPWEKQSDQYWNELCARVVEHFGLPGEKYTSHPEEDWMTFSFTDERDYLMCKMLLSEHIAERTSWTLTVGEDGIVTFPDEVFEKTGWKEGDVLDWQDLGNGSWTLTKKSV